ncbi:hypothetical protein [Halalkalibacter hemicellulosilyticus]|uniref:Lipoprotein n=1 Tax=Halalkalibacter hemicellulosilyticusJCM 9152 TaxID=1236971 RepID=W4QKA4_9BACI|nr:hypothetical protein [Halalkalibacter hemicellulosilyticus]GAE31784.1 hypothetical protein JCM9152_3271 [Halalkalibacter hemicellulosilyticusJCM 9152]
MRKLKGIALVLVMIVTGGCMMNAPDVPAFEDEFTREFMTSTKAVEEGFYLFESKTGGYTIWFPENAVMESVYYEKLGDHRENISIMEEYGENLMYRLRLDYDSRPIATDIDIQLSVLSRLADFEGEYEVFQHGDNTYYYGTSTLDIGDGDRAYRFFSYIKSDKYEKGITFIFMTTCRNFQHPCSVEIEQQEIYAQKLMKSIEFH